MIKYTLYYLVMTLDIALLILCTFISLYLIIIEIFTILFTLTGMNTSKARFQVVSMLTNSGFTTSESELITSSPLRRKLALGTMLFGYTFALVIVSMLVNAVMASAKSDAKNIILALVYVIIFLILIGILRKSNKIKHVFNTLIQNVGFKLIFSKNNNKYFIIDMYGDAVLAELTVTTVPDILQEKTLAESNIHNIYDIIILCIKRNGEIYSSISANDIVQENDTVILFGRPQYITELFGIELQ